MSTQTDTHPQSPMPWTPTYKTHLLHLGIAALLVLASPWMSMPLELPAIALTTAAALSIPLESWKPTWGILLAVAISWTADAVSFYPGAIPFLVVYIASGLGIAHLNNRWICYLGMSAAALFGAVVSEYHLVAIGFSLAYALPSILLGEILRRQRGEILTVHQERQYQLERQRRLMAAELHDTLARDLTHAVMEAQQLKISRSDDQVLADELDAIIIPMRKAVAHLRQSLLSLDTENLQESLAVLATSPPEQFSRVITRTESLLHKRGSELQVIGAEQFTPEKLGPGLYQQTNRILNELLTNAGKYAADGTTVTVEMEVDQDSFDCICTNRISSYRAQDAASSSEMGLLTARERTRAVSGTLSLSQSANRWIAVLSIPLQIPSAESLD